MEEVSLSETESCFFSDLFLLCDVEKTGKIPMLKAMELYRSANLSSDAIREITSLSGIPHTALHISRAQFYASLKLIAAYQDSMPLRQELVAASVQLPLPRFSWKDFSSTADTMTTSGSSLTLGMHQSNGLNSLPPPPPVQDRQDRRNSLPRRTEWQESVSFAGTASGSRRSSAISATAHQQQMNTQHSDVHSTDSDVEQNESSGCGDGTGRSSREEGNRRGGSPEAWSTNSDSPTPTNSVAERPWAKETLWHGLLGDEHRQLLGTEEESSDRHSSDDDHETDLETIYQITPEQREYYFKQFKVVQHDPNGLLSGHVARVFFEKSRIPVEELRHIWQLCDVTRDGALSLAEFTAAMHLVVLRRNNIPLPTVLPACLHPNVLQHSTLASKTLTHEPPEADLLHLNDDEDDDNTDNAITNSIAAVTVGGPAAEKNVMNLSVLSTSSQISTNSRQGVTALTPPHLPPPVQNRSISNSPNLDPHLTTPTLPQTTPLFAKPKERQIWAGDAPLTQWTKFTESPTSNVSSPGPKPVNFDMQRTAQAVVSDPQILHPVPLRVTPVAGSLATGENISGDIEQPPVRKNDSVNTRDASPKLNNMNNNSAAVTTSTAHHRDSLQNNDLRAIQRPQAKKLPVKNIGALPPPPQRETSFGSVGNTSSNAGAGDELTMATPAIASASVTATIGMNGNQQLVLTKKDPPPLPPPRPHRHGRSSSLDLNKFKISAPTGQQPEIMSQTSFDFQSTTGFADFTQFPEDASASIHEQVPEQTLYSLPPQQTTTVALPVPANAATALPPSRFTLQTSQHVSAFEVYRKPATPRNSQSPQLPPPSAINDSVATQQPISKLPPHPPPPPPAAPATASASASIAAPTTSFFPNADLYEKRVTAISETLKHVSFKPDNNTCEILRHLREQNNLLLRICNDLSDELLTVQTQKEEMRLKLEAAVANGAFVDGTVAVTTLTGAAILAAPRTGSSISAPVTSNLTGGSGSSGVHSNV